VNAWSHLAVSYDGANLRLFVNGVNVRTTPMTGSLPTSPNALQIGGDSIFGQYFQGKIDEVRVYKTVRTPTQLKADAATPIGGGSLPELGLSRASIAFASQQVGTSSVGRTLTVTNAGSGVLAFDGVVIGGADVGDFVIQTNGCTAPIAPHASCD